MLRWIRVQNIAVVDSLEIDFSPGLNLITGETGAGKSILVDALGLVLGARASSDLVRSGAASAVVEAGFELVKAPRPLRLRLKEAGVELDDELVIRREVGANGRGKAIVNGGATVASLLRDIATHLADVHGQGESWALLRADASLEVLDGFAAKGALLSKVRGHFRKVRKLEREMQSVLHDTADRKYRREQMTFDLSEITQASLRPGEDQELLEERTRLAHAERLKALAGHGYAWLYEEEGAVLSRLAGVFKAVEALAEIDGSVRPYLEERDTISGQLEDLALFLRDYADEIQFSPARLEAVEDRLSQLGRLKSKHGGSLESVLEQAASFERQLSELERSGASAEDTARALEEARARFRDAASELSAERQKAARKLEKRVAEELPSLALDKARFALSLEEIAESESDRWKETGLDVAEFLFSANPGEELRPLARTASGGELSRFMLALKSISAKGETPRTLVFDEVDAGIGGKVAEKVGEKLRELARTHQVICVTHLPQIASFAAAHFRIDKVESEGRTTTSVVRLDQEGRIDEIARMLAGAEVTESARQHARQLVTDKG